MVMFAGEGHTLECINAENVEHFQKVFRGRTPVLLRGVAQHWRAFRLWRTADANASQCGEGERRARVRGGPYSYLYGLAGKRTVPVEIGRRYTDKGAHSRLIAFGALFARARVSVCVCGWVGGRVGGRVGGWVILHTRHTHTHTHLRSAFAADCIGNAPRSPPPHR